MIPLILALLGTTAASTCQEISGNWYCDPTTEVIYNGLGGVPGSYQRVTDMDPESCTCTKATQAFSGPLSPLDEDLSLHFRGPLQLSQFAAYTMTTTSSTNSKRKKRGLLQKKRFTQEALDKVKRDQYVYTLIPPIYTTSDYQYPSSPATSADIPTQAATTHVVVVATEVATTNTAPVEQLTTTGTVIGLPSQVSTALAQQSTQTTSDAVVLTTASTTISTTSSTTSTTAAAPAATETIWQRTSYYDAAAGIVDNAVFMNNMGGVNGDNGSSGTWSPCFGNSLSYASTSGLSTSSTPLVLGDITLPSDSEFIIFSGEPCTTETCGYVMEGVPAYVGFGGANKMFMFEFSMPSDAANIGNFNGDMPAIWALNAQIPRSSQYGTCSCWTTGCGELDLFEVLSGGSNYLTTTFHSVSGGGGATSDYFERPTTGYMKAAVIFIGATKEIQIIELDSSVDFSESMAYDIFDDWQQTYISEVTLTD